MYNAHNQILAFSFNGKDKNKKTHIKDVS